MQFKNETQARLKVCILPLDAFSTGNGFPIHVFGFIIDIFSASRQKCSYHSNESSSSPAMAILIPYATYKL